MPSQPVASNAVMSAIRLPRQPLVSAQVLGRLQLLAVAVRLAKAESDKLKRHPDTAIVQSEDNKRWCTLQRWLDMTPAEKGGILCRRSGLSIRFDRRSESDLPSNVNLLPFDSSSPLKAELRYPGGGTEHAHSMRAQIDHREKCLNLLLPFDETRQGQERYEAALKALSRPPGVTVHLSYGHAWETAPARTAPPGPRPPTPQPQPPTPPRRSPNVIVRDHRSTAPAERARVPARRPDVVVRDHRSTSPATRRATPDTVTVLPRVRMARTIDADALRVAATAIARPRTLPENQPQHETVSVRREFETSKLSRPLDDKAAFPDWLHFDLPGGWAQYEPADSRRLYYRPSPLLDTFLYLPSRFKLGYFLDPDGFAGLPPVRVRQYRDSEDRHRFKVTLVAVPHVDDADRESLRRYVKDVVLSGQMPFVRLQQAGGLVAEFASHFTAGRGDDQHDLPAGIESKVVLLDIDSRLILEFDMPAERYEIFCQLLLRGLRGSVSVSSEVQNSIPVSLDLTDVITNPVVVAAAPEAGMDGVLLWQEGERVTEEDESEAVVVDEGEEATIDLVLKNCLDYPVRLSSLKAILLDTGSLPGTIWEAEEVDLLSERTTVIAGRREEQDNQLVVPIGQKTIAFWNETVIQVGQVQVDGGSPTDWLRRVHQDPSLQPAEFGLRIEAIPTPGDDQVQTIRLRLLKAGTPDVRQEREIRPAAGMVVWPLHMTLNELAGLEGERARFVLEYDCVLLDGRISLPQRIPVDLGGAELLLRPVVETARSVFTVEVQQPHRETHEELSRTQAEDLVRRLVAEGSEWRVYAREAGVSEPIEGPSPEPDPEEPVPQPDAGPQVTIVTDLLNQALDSGDLLNVFVVLQADEDGAPETTLNISADRRAGHTWRPANDSVPPFRYKITYLLAGGHARQKQGVEQSLVLLLDPSDVS